MLRMKAPAKVNLTLEILSRRPDGYHDIVSIMQTLGLYDELCFENSSSLSLHCNVAALQNGDNLVLKAARMLQQEGGYRGGATISLRKKIYMDAGLGGGSSDAAITLLALNELWSLGCSKDDLIMMAAEIGSDVPFFIEGGTCLVEGRGERLTSLPDMQQAWFVLLAPDFQPLPGKTGELYKMVSREIYTDGKLTSILRSKLEAGEPLEPQHLFNTFEAVAFRAYPALESYWKIFAGAGGGDVHLAGSGPLIFKMLTRQEEAQTLGEKLKALGLRALVVPSLSRRELGY